MEVVFTGHGPAGAPSKLIGAQRDYLLTLASHVKELANGGTALSEEQRKELEHRMIAYLPDAGLTFLIGMNADPIARELNAAR
jgi:hypothetical protein